MTATRDISNLVSIVLPVRDQGDHIRQVLGEYVAALDRANFDFEIIAVVNGKQRDSSREECESVAVADPRVRVHTTEQGGGGGPGEAGPPPEPGRLPVLHKLRSDPG
jgi:glycosyltransferase involved in cell wall biosynthesis